MKILRIQPKVHQFLQNHIIMVDSMFILYQLGFYPHEFKKSRVLVISPQNPRKGATNLHTKTLGIIPKTQNTHDSNTKSYLFALLPLLLPPLRLLPLLPLLSSLLHGCPSQNESKCDILFVSPPFIVSYFS